MVSARHVDAGAGELDGPVAGVGVGVHHVGQVNLIGKQRSNQLRLAVREAGDPLEEGRRVLG